MDNLDELKSTISNTLERSGILAKIRAQLRKSVYDVLEENEPSLTSVNNGTKLNELQNNTDTQLACELIRDFLVYYELDYTLSVFQQESKIQQATPSQSTSNSNSNNAANQNTITQQNRLMLQNKYGLTLTHTPSNTVAGSSSTSNGSGSASAPTSTDNTSNTPLLIQLLQRQFINSTIASPSPASASAPSQASTSLSTLQSLAITNPNNSTVRSPSGNTTNTTAPPHSPVAKLSNHYSSNRLLHVGGSGNHSPSNSISGSWDGVLMNMNANTNTNITQQPHQQHSAAQVPSNTNKAHPFSTSTSNTTSPASSTSTITNQPATSTPSSSSLNTSATLTSLSSLPAPTKKSNLLTPLNTLSSNTSSAPSGNKLAPLTKPNELNTSSSTHANTSTPALSSIDNGEANLRNIEQRLNNSASNPMNHSKSQNHNVNTNTGTTGGDVDDYENEFLSDNDAEVDESIAEEAIEEGSTGHETPKSHANAKDGDKQQSHSKKNNGNAAKSALSPVSNNTENVNPNTNGHTTAQKASGKLIPINNNKAPGPASASAYSPVNGIVNSNASGVTLDHYSGDVSLHEQPHADEEFDFDSVSGVDDAF